MSVNYYWLRFKTEWQSYLEYRADIFIYALSSIVTPIIGLAVWISVANTGVNLAYSKADLVTYFLLVMFINNITAVWGSYFVGEKINNGGFSMYLLKPISIMGEYAINNLVEKLQKLLFVTIGIILTSYFLLGFGYLEFKISVFSLVLFLPSLLMAIVINFILDMTLGLATFWTHDSYFLSSLSSLARDFFSGRIIPIIFLPMVVKEVVTLSPLRYVISFPIEVLLNKLTTPDLIFGFILEFSWLLVLLILYKLIFKLGVKRYQGYGG